jgi:hypothetical protein
MTENTKLYDYPIKTFDPENLLNEMLNAKDGQVFILGQKEIKNHEGDPTIETTMVTIEKFRS